MGEKISRSTGEAYLGIAIAIFVAVFPVGWWVKVILMCIVGALAVDIVFRHPWTIGFHWLTRTLLAVLGIVFLAAISYKPIHKQYSDDLKQDTSEPQPKKSETLKIKTIHDLFVSDCSHTQMLGTYTFTPVGVVYPIEYSVCGDFQTKSLYLSFFLPKSDYTLPACKYLPSAYAQILNGKIKLLMQGMTHQAPGEKGETWADLRPSGRVFVYHETLLLPADIEDLALEYKKAELSPQFRGRDYEIMKNSPLYDGQHY